MKHMGPFVGQLLLRSFDRADRVYAAMKCRGYGNALHVHSIPRWGKNDCIFILVTCLPCIFLRLFNVTELINRMIGGLL